MENTNEMAPATAVEEKDAIMPDGWDESVNIFDETWANGKSSGADEHAEKSLSDLFSTDNGAEDGSQDSANDTEKSSAESKGDSKGQPATPDDASTQSRKIKFSTTVNHKNRDIELDENEVPEIYQQAQGLKSARKKLDSMTPVYEKAEFLTELLGYDSIDEMLDAAQKAYEDGKTSQLVGENVHPEVAEDIVKREVKDTADKVNQARKTKEEEQELENNNSGVRDFKPEVAALLKKYPTLRGQTLPQEVVDRSVRTGEPLVAVYADYRAGLKEAENERLRKENSTLKQNAETARRAPVKGVANGGTADTSGGDEFLKGFNRY